MMDFLLSVSLGLLAEAVLVGVVDRVMARPPTPVETPPHYACVMEYENNCLRMLVVPMDKPGS